MYVYECMYVFMHVCTYVCNYERFRGAKIKSSVWHLFWSLNDKMWETWDNSCWWILNWCHVTDQRDLGRDEVTEVTEVTEAAQQWPCVQTLRVCAMNFLVITLKALLQETELTW